MNFKSKVVSILGAGMILLSSVAGAAASTNAEVTVEVNVPSGGGLKIISVHAPEQFGNVTTSMTDSPVVSSKLQIKVEDSTFSGSGWHLTLSAGDFRSQNGNNGVIPVSNLTITSASVQRDSGQDWNGTTASSAAMATGQPTKVASANVGHGTGAYTVEVNNSLKVPPMTKPGTYKTTVSVSLNSAP